MSTRYIVRDLIGAGTQIDMSTWDNAYVRAGAVVMSTDTHAILGSTAEGEGHRVDVFGGVVGNLDAINLGAENTFDDVMQVNVAAGGFAYSELEFAVRINGHDSVMTNAGEIAGVTGIRISGYGNRVVNSGVIQAENTGVVGNSFVDPVTGNAEMTLINSGSISGFYAFRGESGNGHARIFNIGFMEGKIEFGDGNDIYSGANVT